MDFADAFLSELQNIGGRLDREVIHHTRIDSTSSDLKRRLKAGAKLGTVVAAGAQTAGRGRRGRSWFSPSGGNLYVSLAVATDPPGTPNFNYMPLAAGIAGIDAICACYRAEPKLKWPNDILLDHKKVAGILCEVWDVAATPVLAVIGLGVNIAHTRFPDALQSIATTLDSTDPLLQGRSGQRVRSMGARLAANWVNRIEHWMDEIRIGQGTALIHAWKERAEPFGRCVRVGDVAGVTKTLTGAGHLVVVTDAGDEITITGGVVSSECQSDDVLW